VADKSKTGDLTVLIVPHDDSKTLSFRLPIWIIQLLVILQAVVLAGVFFLIRGYLLRSNQANELKQLRNANRVQEEQINQMTQETEELMNMMEQLEYLSEQIKELMGEADEKSDVSQLTDSQVGSFQVASRGESSVYSRAEGNLRILQTNLPLQLEHLDKLKTDLEEHNRRLEATPSKWPTHGWITSRFGYRKDPFTHRVEFHNGLDIGAPYGTRVYASCSGRVEKATYNRGWGNLVVIKNGYGFSTYYAHLSRYIVNPGEWVSKGDLIGYVGNSGRSTGPHLHFEIRVNGVAVNPLNYLK